MSNDNMHSQLKPGLMIRAVGQYTYTEVGWHGGMFRFRHGFSLDRGSEKPMRVLYAHIHSPIHHSGRDARYKYLHHGCTVLALHFDKLYYKLQVLLPGSTRSNTLLS